MKQIKDLGEKEVIWCKTQSECEAIAELIDEKNGNDYWKTERHFDNDYIDSFCFNVKLDTCSPLWYYQKEGYIIHNAKDFLEKPNEVKEELQDILKEWEESKFLKGLNKIIRERLK